MVRILDPAHEQHELVPANASGHVILPHTFVYGITKGPEYHITGLMPPLIIDVLKVIQVQDKQGTNVSLRMFQTGAAQLLRSAFVFQSGQGVRLRLTPQQCLHGNGRLQLLILFLENQILQFLVAGVVTHEQDSHSQQRNRYDPKCKI